MTFSGRLSVLLNTTLHVQRHRGQTLLRKGCEVVILIETGFSFHPRKVVPLQGNSHKGFPPLPMCPLRPYNDGSWFFLPNFPDTLGKPMIGRAHPIQFAWVRGVGKEIES